MTPKEIPRALREPGIGLTVYGVLSRELISASAARCRHRRRRDQLAMPASEREA